jgi:hypothetical protein
LGEPEGYSFHASEHFLKNLQGFRKSDPEGHAHIQKVIERLLRSPEDNDGMLTGPHRGKMKKYVGRSGYRLIFKWCRSCQKLGAGLGEDCPSCGTLPPDSVVFLDVFHKSEAGKLDY